MGTLKREVARQQKELRQSYDSGSGARSSAGGGGRAKGGKGVDFLAELVVKADHSPKRGGRKGSSGKRASREKERGGGESLRRGKGKGGGAIAADRRGPRGQKAQL